MSGHINLTTATPPFEVFNPRTLHQGFQGILSDPEKTAEAASTGPDVNYVPLRETIAKWLQPRYSPQLDISVDRIAITNGYFYANLEDILPAFAKPEYTNVWIAEPCLPMRWWTLEDCGFEGRVRGVPEDEGGMDLDYLQSALEDVEKSDTLRLAAANASQRKVFRHIIYVVPTFSSPSGKVMSISSRERLLRLARQFDALVVTEDSRDHIRWPQDETVDLSELPPLPPRIVDIDRTRDGGPKTEWGNAISAGSFDFLLRPPIRIGWAEAMPALIRSLPAPGKYGTMGATFLVKALFVHRMLQSGDFDRHLNDKAIPVTRSKYYLLCRLFEQHLRPLGFTRVRDSADGTRAVGGGFLYVTLPDDLPALEQDFIYKAANVSVATGATLAVKGHLAGVESAAQNNDYGKCWALSWVTYGEDQTREAVEKLARLVSDVRSGRQPPPTG